VKYGVIKLRSYVHAMEDVRGTSRPSELMALILYNIHDIS